MQTTCNVQFDLGRDLTYNNDLQTNKTFHISLHFSPTLGHEAISRKLAITYGSRTALFGIIKGKHFTDPLLT